MYLAASIYLIVIRADSLYATVLVLYTRRMATDYYAILGIKRDASQKEVTRAFRRLARQYHPDVNPGNPEAERRFKEINAAHEVLSNADNRRKYDQYGDEWQHADQIEAMRRRQGAGGYGGMPGGGGASFEFDMADLSDLFGGGPGGARPGANAGRGGVFDSFFRRGGGRRGGQDIEHSTRITLDEAYRGTTRTIEVRDAAEVCRVCGGEGKLAGAICHACRGTGSASPVRRIEVTIPGGVQDGTRIRVAGKGGEGSGGAPPGDLYLRVEVSAHPRFERRGDDLHVEVDVPIADAALGGEVRVPTLKGRALALTIPAGTQSGKVFRLAGQGMPRARGGFGDLHAKVRLVLPERLTDEQRALFERLRDSSGGRTTDGGERETSGVAS